jgi:hypothetical protein
MEVIRQEGKHEGKWEREGAENVRKLEHFPYL